MKSKKKRKTAPERLPSAAGSVAWLDAAHDLTVGAMKLKVAGHICAARHNVKMAILCDKIARLLKNENL